MLHRKALRTWNFEKLPISVSTTKCKVLSAAQGTFCSGSSRPFPQSLREGSIEYVSILPKVPRHGVPKVPCLVQVADGTGQEVFSGNERCLLPSNLARGVREQRHKHDVATVLIAGMIYLQVPWGEVGGTGWNKEKGPEQPQTQTNPPLPAIPRDLFYLSKRRYFLFRPLHPLPGSVCAPPKKTLAGRCGSPTLEKN